MRRDNITRMRRKTRVVWGNEKDVRIRKQGRIVCLAKRTRYHHNLM